MDWSNRMVECGVDRPTHISRIITSWRNAGGFCDYGGQFEEWLKSLGLDRNTIADIEEMACCGKLELEISARKFLEEHPEEDW